MGAILRNLAQFGAKWRQIGTSGALREKCSESTPQKSMIPLLLRYYTTFYEQPFGFYSDWRKIAQFRRKLRNISSCPNYAKLHEPDSDYLDPIDEISAKKLPA